MEAIAKTKYLKGSPRKARLVIDLIRGRNVSQALAILKFTDKRAADPIAKCLSSAIANATYLAEQQNIAIDPDELWVKTCFVDMGPTKNRRRMRPAPQGRAYREQRHYCHITIQISSDEQQDSKFAKKAAPVKTEAGDKKRKTSAKKDEAETKSPKATEASKPVVEADAQGTAEASDAKNVTSQTPAERHETKPADQAQLNTNEELERQ
ncbi:MAG: ribosomal protein [Acidobacteria bacterium]|jgi:large subunit ribosomal protein L22|nr:ribosomal protein [Acidobacteriota bacterium]